MRTAFRAVGAVAPGVAARWAETLFCTPPRRPGGDGRFLAAGARFTLESQGQRLTGWEWGSGRTVVLVHGWGGCASRFGALGAGLLEAGFRVVAYDAPTHGESTGRFASLPEFARALSDVAASVGPIHGLVGHSLGGAAVAMAMRHGVEARRVVLLAPPADVRIFSDLFARSLAIAPDGTGSCGTTCTSRPWCGSCPLRRSSSTTGTTPTCLSPTPRRSWARGPARGWRPRPAWATARSCAIPR